MSDAGPAPGTLYLVPVSLGSDDPRLVLPPSTLAIARDLEVFAVENPKTARDFLKRIGHPRPMRELAIHTLDKRTGDREVKALGALLTAGRPCGLLSEAGCPAVADPGSALVRLAHGAGVPVVPLVGPSSILLALMASGMDGQHFAFHGYLPVEAGARARRIRQIEIQASQATQIFIETPYRNDRLMAALARVCEPATLLCVATDLTLASESVRTAAIAEWRRAPSAIGKRPTVFLLLASA